MLRADKVLAGGRLDGRAGRQRGARVRRALPPSLRHDRRRRPRLPARSAGSGDAARRRRPQTRGRPRRRGASPRPSRSPKSAPPTRSRSCASPGISATATWPPSSTPKALRIRRDPVIEDMARGLGARDRAGRGAVQSRRRRLCAAEPAHAPSPEHAHHGDRRIIGDDHARDHAGHDHSHHDHAIMVATTQHGRRVTTTTITATTTDMGAAERRHLAPAADAVAVAGVPGRFVRLFARARMGGRGRRHF